MNRIYWDTMLFVYFLEDHPQYAPRMEHIFRKMRERGDTLCISVFGLGEILVGPNKRGATEVARQIRDFFRGPEVELLPFTPESAEHFARIRADHRASPADAIHLASAATTGVDLFLTNDKKLQGLIVPGIRFIAGIDVSLF